MWRTLPPFIASKGVLGTKFPLRTASMFSLYCVITSDIVNVYTKYNKSSSKLPSDPLMSCSSGVPCTVLAI